MSVIPLREAEAEPIRIAPHNTKDEQALLGAIFRNNVVYGRVVDFLRPEHFANAVHGRIFAAIGTLIDRGRVADPPSLKNLFDQDGVLAEIGGGQYLTLLANSAVALLGAEDYGRRIHDLHLRRQLIGLGEDVVNDAFRHDLDDDAVTQIERAEARLYELASSGQAEGGGGPRPHGDARRRALAAAQENYKRGGAIVGVPTGFMDLDKLLGGLRPSHLVVVGARPSMGKSSLALDIARHLAHAGKRALFFSLEMSAEDIANRNLAVATGISADDISRGNLSPKDFEKLVVPDEALDRNLIVDDTGRLSVAQIRSRARRLIRRGGGDLIIVDHLHLMQPDAGRRDHNRVAELAAMTAGLKSLAKELGLPILLMAQLNRSVENRDDWKPRLADLRESGSIEQDADVVMMLFRKEYYLSRLSEPKDDKGRADLAAERAQWAGIAQVFVEKNRGGPIGNVGLAFRAELTHFESLTRGQV
jgi:replicative DNA helicase